MSERVGGAPDLAPRALPFVTEQLAGLGGAIKLSPEDFEVEELAEVVPSGAGEHLYLWVEKRGRETAEVARALAQAAGVSPRDVGYAGLKDRQALTRQWFSVPTASSLDGFAVDGVRLLTRARHSQKLRTGRLRGNRFTIRLRGTEDAVGAERLLAALAESGVPNWFGPQRFGRHGDNAFVGAALLGVGSHPAAARAARDPFLRKLCLSALQSELFNRLLADRVREQRLADLELGDVVLLPEDPRPTVAKDVEPLLPRIARFEAAVAGPMFSEGGLKPEAHPAQREAAVLAGAGLSLQDFARGGRELRGTRRPYRFRLTGVNVARESDGLVLQFELPPGSYATSVLRELTRSAVPAAGDEEAA